MVNKTAITLCRLDELHENSSRGFQPQGLATIQSIFLVRKNDRVYGYINSCPHTGAPLEWMPDQFLSLDREQIQCALHGARFEIDTGLCVQGPCVNSSLTPITIEIADQQVVWKMESTTELP